MSSTTSATLPTVSISPFVVHPSPHCRRDMPVNELGAADFSNLLEHDHEDAQRTEALRGLLRDVETDRVIYPILVREQRGAGSQRYQLVSGWLVWSAAVHLRKEAVSAFLWDGDDLEAAALAYQLNHHRVTMKRKEAAHIAGIVADLLAETGQATYRDVARTLRCSPSWAHKLVHNGSGDPTDEASGRRPRGRPPVSVLFNLEVTDPRHWESTVRLRAITQGKPPLQEIKLQRSEESDGWRDVSSQAFFEAIAVEVDRLRDWLADIADGDFSPGKITVSAAIESLPVPAVYRRQ